MRPEDMRPVEVLAPCLFGSTASLVRHVVKHVLDGHDQRWQQIVGVALLSAARDEHARGDFGPACIAVAARYQDAMGQSLVEACNSRSRHGHLAQCALADDLAYEATAQAVEAWDPKARLFVAARAIVRNGKLASYRLQTGFRPWPGLGGQGFARAAREMVMERARRRARRMIEIHD